MEWSAIKKRREARAIQLSVFRPDFTSGPVGAACNRIGSSKEVVKPWFKMRLAV